MKSLQEQSVVVSDIIHNVGGIIHNQPKCIDNVRDKRSGAVLAQNKDSWPSNSIKGKVLANVTDCLTDIVGYHVQSPSFHNRISQRNPILT